MDINKVLIEYDNMFGVNSMSEIEEFLVGQIEKAREEHDYNSALSLMNEMMSLCRDTSQSAKGLHYCTCVEDMLVKLGLEGTVEYATSLINVANAYRAFGYYNKAESLFERVEVIYREKLSAGDFNFASLHNNWSLLYQETGEFRKSEMHLRKALRVINLQENALIQQATTRCNLATTLLRIAGGAPLDKEGQKLDASAAESVYEEALVLLQEAIRIFEWDGERDFHYSGALSAMGDALYLKEDYVHAAEYYKRAMDEIEKHVGQTDAYKILEANYAQASILAEEQKAKDSAFVEKPKSVFNQPEGPIMDVEDAFEDKSQIAFVSRRKGVQMEVDNTPSKPESWLDVCRRFYEEFGAPMIREKFSEYENRIAVGLVGDGSDCFGFDDAISMDHDYGLGFCMWLTDDDYQAIGAALQQAYEELLAEKGDFFLEDSRKAALLNSVGTFLHSRRGVFGIREFYENTLGVKLIRGEDGKLVPDHFMQITEDKLAVATNGAVFCDAAGTFSQVRETLLEYYPTQVWMLRLAEKLHMFAQTAQSNYARMMARQEYVAANLCVAKGLESAMEIIYLLNQTYAPYYKWMRKGLDSLPILKQAIPVLDKLAILPNQALAWEGEMYSPYEMNREDEILMAFESLAEMILKELRVQGIVDGTDTFLDIYSNDLIQRALNKDFDGVDVTVNEDVAEKPVNLQRVYEWGKDDSFDRDEVIAEIVEEEWKQFDKVENEGGRADCQDDWNTFSIMRKSQYMAWSNELLTSFLKDLKDAKAKGWNLITEKYARMMKSTAPAQYAMLESSLPERTEERIKITEEIVRIQIEWMEEFAQMYPKMAGNARSIHTSEDNEYNTSYETYLRGELGTYSEETFIMYGRYISELMQKGENLAYMIMSNTARLYGYAGVEDAERRME